jgi:16S rRNA U516 pseudouridylate synthase RsuA-like enzyme
MPTKPAAPPTDVPRAKQLRLTLTEAEWRALRVMAAEQDMSMQRLVAETMQREIAQHVRARATENALSIGKAGKRKGSA